MLKGFKLGLGQIVQAGPMRATSICGVIKQNQSDVDQIQFSFNKLYAPFSQLHFAENPIEIGQLVPEIGVVEGYQKQ